MTQTFADNDNAFMGIFDSAPTKSDAVKANDTESATQGVSATVSNESDSSSSTDSQQQVSNQTAVEPTARRRGRRKKADTHSDSGNLDTTGHFSCICDTKLIKQVRAIAWQEHMTVRAIVESMFSKCIAKYEKRHGPILIEQKQSHEDLF